MFGEGGTQGMADEAGGAIGWCDVEGGDFGIHILAPSYEAGAFHLFGGDPGAVKVHGADGKAGFGEAKADEAAFFKAINYFLVHFRTDVIDFVEVFKDQG